MMFMNQPIAWINGQVQPFIAASIPVWDLGVVAGASVTEMARTFRHQPFRLNQHLERLLTSCRQLGFSVSYDQNELRQAIDHVVQGNVQLIPKNSDLGIVMFVTAGVNSTYLGGQRSAGTVCIHTFELPFAMWKAGLSHGVKLQVPPLRQIPSDCWDVSHKVRNRMHWWLADQAANQQQSGARALLLDHDNCLTETSTACFYAVIDDRIVTPDQHTLNSLSRKVVEELAEQLEIPFCRRALHQKEIPLMSEAFLSSTPSCLLPVSEINGLQIGRRRLMHAVQHGATNESKSYCEALQTAWSRLVGIDIVDQILTG